MRHKQEIEKDFYQFTSEKNTQRLFMEVLLDIRDLLQSPPIEITEVRQAHYDKDMRLWVKEDGTTEHYKHQDENYSNYCGMNWCRCGE